MDGEVIVEVKADTKSFEKQIEYVESKMKEIEEKLQQADMGFEVGDTQKLEAEYERLGNQLVDLRSKQEAINNEGYEEVSKSVQKVSSGHSNILKKI